MDLCYAKMEIVCSALGDKDHRAAPNIDRESKLKRSQELSGLQTIITVKLNEFQNHQIKYKGNPMCPQ